MNIREKIAARKNIYETNDRQSLNRALIRMSLIILAGYLVGTGIALLIERL